MGNSKFEDWETSNNSETATSCPQTLVLLSKNSDELQFRIYFENIAKLVDSGKEFPVNLEEVWPLVYGQKYDAVVALKKRFRRKY